jgi:hypothetical protein
VHSHLPPALRNICFLVSSENAIVFVLFPEKIHAHSVDKFNNSADINRTGKMVDYGNEAARLLSLCSLPD